MNSKCRGFDDYSKCSVLSFDLKSANGPLCLLIARSVLAAWRGAGETDTEWLRDDGHTRADVARVFIFCRLARLVAGDILL